MRLQVDSPYCWLQAISAFLFHGVFFGLVFSFGIFYVALLEDFPGQESQAAWISGINFGAIMLMSPLTIRLLNYVPARVVCCTGTLLASLGLFLASKANSMLVLYMTFGVMHGIGTNLCYMSAIWILRKNFHRRLDLAFGLSSAGSGAGGVMFGIMLPTVVDSRGWRGALELVSYITLAFVLVSMVMIPAQQPGEKVVVTSQEKKSLLPWKRNVKALRISVPSPWRNRAFVVLTIAILMCAFVSSVPYCHIVNYAIHQGVRKSEGERLPLIMSIGSLIGRITVGRISGFRQVSRITLCQITFLVQCLATTLCTLATNTAGLGTFSFVFGTFDGAFSVLLAIVVDDVFWDKNRALAAIGQLFQMLAIPYAFGAPLAGWLYSKTGSYHVPFLFCGALLFFAACLISLARYFLRSASETPVLSLPEKIVIFSLDENPGDLVPVPNRLIASRACSFMDLAVEVYGDQNTRDQMTFSSTNLSVYPRRGHYLEVGGLDSRRDSMVCSQDFLKANGNSIYHMENKYTDISNQISGLFKSENIFSSTHHIVEPSCAVDMGDVDNNDVIANGNVSEDDVKANCDIMENSDVMDGNVSDTSSLDDVDIGLKHGSSGISIDDAGYCSAPAPANYVDSDTQSVTSQNDVSFSECLYKKGSLDSFIEIDFIDDGKMMKDGFYVEDFDHAAECEIIGRVYE